MKYVSRLSLAVIALAGLGLSGCQIVASPMAGAIFGETKYGFVATDASAASKEGKACGTSILGLVAQGDASIQAAKAAGGVSTVASVDHYAKNILGVYGEWCTIVRGN
ncbi:MAG: TRL-like family protein [Nitrospira sp.]|nr:TRL-like family protein [Nitrospira sp.]